MSWEAVVTESGRSGVKPSPSPGVCSRSSRQRKREGKMDGFQAGIEPAFEVLPWPSEFLRPGEDALDHPTLLDGRESRVRGVCRFAPASPNKPGRFFLAGEAECPWCFLSGLRSHPSSVSDLVLAAVNTEINRHRQHYTFAYGRIKQSLGRMATAVLIRCESRS